MKKENLIGNWRSFKIFCHSGKIEKHSFSRFVEININDKMELSLKYTYGLQDKISLKAGEWRVEEIKKHQLLFFGKKQAFEIITLESKNLVLQDHIRGEKLFFVRLPDWNNYIVPETPSYKVILSNSSVNRD